MCSLKQNDYYYECESEAREEMLLRKQDEELERKKRMAFDDIIYDHLG